MPQKIDIYSLGKMFLRSIWEWGHSPSYFHPATSCAAAAKKLLGLTSESITYCLTNWPQQHQPRHCGNWTVNMRGRPPWNQPMHIHTETMLWPIAPGGVMTCEASPSSSGDIRSTTWHRRWFGVWQQLVKYHSSRNERERASTSTMEAAPISTHDIMLKCDTPCAICSGRFVLPAIIELWSVKVAHGIALFCKTGYTGGAS